MTGNTPWPAVINLGNGLIGVSILAMPFCFKECGVILGCLLLYLGSKLNKYSCNLLLRASKVTRRSSYEMLSYHTLGPVGKSAIEMCIICFLMACAVAYFIIMGDLGPAIISKWFGFQNDERLRVGFLVFLTLFFILPLCQKRNLDSISNVSIISIVFYILFALDLVIDSIPILLAGEWIHTIKFWDNSGLVRGVSIFAAAFSCQTVLFAVYESVRERSPKVMEDVVDKAITFVFVLYCIVGFCGYVTYHTPGSPKGDILLDFQQCFMSEILRLGFSFSVALSFPLAVFPSRTSIYTLFFSSSHSLENPHGGGGEADFIPPGKLRLITFFIVIATLILGITIPNVETILGINGAVMGNLTCFIFPALIVLKTPNMPGRNLAKVLLFIGLFLMTTSTYSNLQAAMEVNTKMKPYKDKAVNIPDENFNELEEKKGLGDEQAMDMLGHRINEARKMVDDLKNNEPVIDSKEGKREELPILSNERKEPAIPQEPNEHRQADHIEEELIKEKEIQIDLEETKEDNDKDKDLELDKRKADLPEDRADKDDAVKHDLGGAGEERQEPAKEVEAPSKERDEERDEGKKDVDGGNKELDGGDEVLEGGQEVLELDKRGIDLEGDEKRHKKEAKAIQKQSKKIKELEEMQKKHAEVIENQANALEYLLNKQKEEVDADPADQGLVQPGGELNDQMIAQQQPVVPAVQYQQQPVVQDQQNLQPGVANQPQMLQNQQPILQNQQPILQNQQPILQNQQQPVLMNQQPVLPDQQQQILGQDKQMLLQNPQAPIQEQQMLLNQLNQQPGLPNVVLQDQQGGLQNQLAELQQQPAVQNQQPLVQNQQPLVQNQQPILQQQGMDLNQQALIQQQGMNINQQPIIQQQGMDLNQQPLIQQQGMDLNQQALLQQQGMDLNKQPLLQQQGMNINQQPIIPQQGMDLNQQALLQQQGMDLNQQALLQQQLAPLPGEAGFAQQQEGIPVQQPGQGFPQVQNDAIPLQGQGNIPMAQQPAMLQNPQMVVQMNQQQVPQQPLPPQQVPQQQVPLQEQQLQPQVVVDPQALQQGQQLQPVQQQFQQQVQQDQQLLQQQQPLEMEVAQDGPLILGGENMNVFDQNLVNLPDRLEIQKRGIDVAIAGNQRVLQSHHYEGDSRETEDKVGAGDGEGWLEEGGPGKEGEQGEVQEAEQNEETEREEGGELLAGKDGGVIGEGKDIVKSNKLESNNGTDEEGKVEGENKHHGKKHHKKEEIPDEDDQGDAVMDVLG